MKVVYMQVLEFDAARKIKGYREHYPNTKFTDEAIATVITELAGFKKYETVSRTYKDWEDYSI